MKKLLATLFAASLLTGAIATSFAAPDQDKKTTKTTKGTMTSATAKGHGKMAAAKGHGKVAKGTMKKGHGKMAAAKGHGKMAATTKTATTTTKKK